MISQVASLGTDIWVRRTNGAGPVESAEPQAAPAAPAPASPGASAPLLAGALVGQLQQLDVSAPGGPEAFAAARAAGVYGLASMPETAMLTAAPPKASLTEVSGLGFVSGDVFTSGDAGKLRAYLRDQVELARAAARQEQQLSREAGVEVRLAYDPDAQRTVVLRPGDAGYDTVQGARAMFDRMGADLQKMGQNRKDYADLLTL